MSQWKEKLSNVPIIGEPRALTASEWEYNFGLIQDFISTEIIEKLIDEIPNQLSFDDALELKQTKQQLRDKWL